MSALIVCPSCGKRLRLNNSLASLRDRVLIRGIKCPCRGGARAVPGRGGPTRWAASRYL
jgi:hypothetical protein